MKYFKCTYNEQRREFEREEMTREQAEKYLARYYRREAVPEMLDNNAEIRTMFGYVEVVKD